MKEKRYSKQSLRERLERAMQEKNPAITVSPMEFARWLGIYCDKTGLPDKIRVAKTLDEEVAQAFGKWLGYPF